MINDYQKMISEEDVDKLTKTEIKLFDNIKKEYPLLNKYESKVFEQFKLHYNAIIYIFNAHGGDIYSHNLVMGGAILRSLNFYRGAIWALGERNPHVFFDSLRSQCETLALIHYCILNPEYVKAATIGSRGHKDKNLNIPNILEMIDKINEKYKGIRQDYDALCELVHPNPGSLYANILPKEEYQEGRILKATFGTRSPRITQNDADRYILLLIHWTDWIIKELEDMSKLFVEILKRNN